MSEGVSDLNDLFDLPDVCVATVDVVSYSGDGSEECLVGIGVISEGDGCLCSPKWCANGGITTWNSLYGGCDVFLVRVIELTGGGLIWMWEVAVSDADEGGRCNILYT